MSLQHIIGCCDYNTIAMKADGTVYYVGPDWNGEQAAVATWADIVAIAVGRWTMFGLKPDGTVVGAGDNWSDKVSATSTWTDIAKVVPGVNFTAGVKTDGTIIFVGDTGGLSGAAEAWDGNELVDITAGNLFIVGVKEDGTMLYDGTTSYDVNDCAAWTGIVAVSALDQFVIGLKSDGTVLSAGRNNYGQLAANLWTDIATISAGRTHAVGIKTDGTLVGVGRNNHGQTDVSLWENIVAISAGDLQTTGVYSDGTTISIGEDSSDYGFLATTASGWTGLAVSSEPPPVDPGDPEITNAGRYTLTITGTPPVLIPCANFLARLRSARRSYLQVTIPYTQENAELITARSAEDLQLRFYDYLGDPHVLLDVKIDSIQVIQGVQSSSIIMAGWRQSTNNTPTSHAIQAMTVSSGSTAGTMLMPGYRPEIKPADTVSANGVSFIAGLVTVQGAARQYDTEVRTTMSSAGGTLTGGLSAPQVSIRPSISVGALSLQYLAPQLTIQPVISVGALSGYSDGILSAATLSVQPSVTVGTLTAAA